MQAISFQPARQRARCETWRKTWRAGLAVRGVEMALRPLQALMAVPSFLFLAALTAMLLRPPDVQFYAVDRVAFVLLVAGAVGRAVVRQQPVLMIERATWPMLGLTLLAVGSLAGQRFDSEAWSLLAAKIIVPFTLFHLAGLVFAEEREFRRFEIFALVVLAYLSFLAIAFLADAKSLIYPQFILDESLGRHVDRARGPFLQAVANGVSLNLLGLLALHAYRRGSVRGAKVVLLLMSLPVAIVATLTRAVWVSFAGSAFAVTFLSGNRRSGIRVMQQVLLGVALALGAGVAVILCSPDLGCTLIDRLEERGPVDYRQAVYAGGWDMFLQRPLTGWGFHQMPGELPRHVSGYYTEKELYPHNTYLELLVEHGVLGLALYLWLMWELWRLGRAPVPAGERRGFLDAQFHRLWPVLLAVYWVNAAMVVMSYQFVNGLLFTLAGMLAGQRRRAEASQPC